MIQGVSSLALLNRVGASFSASVQENDKIIFCVRKTHSAAGCETGRRGKSSFRVLVRASWGLNWNSGCEDLKKKENLGNNED